MHGKMGRDCDTSFKFRPLPVRDDLSLLFREESNPLVLSVPFREQCEVYKTIWFLGRLSDIITCTGAESQTSLRSLPKVLRLRGIQAWEAWKLVSWIFRYLAGPWILWTFNELKEKRIPGCSKYQCSNAKVPVDTGLLVAISLLNISPDSPTYTHSLSFVFFFVTVARLQSHLCRLFWASGMTESDHQTANIRVRTFTYT